MTKGSQPKQTRASGLAQSEEVVREEAESFEDHVEPALPEERARRHQTPGFARMRMEWKGDDRLVMQSARDAVDGRILRLYADAYQIMHELYDVVREPEVDLETGEIQQDQWGFTVWKRTPSGAYVEDYTRLTRDQRERFLFEITTRLFDWEQRAGNAWGEAMLAKAQWEERFAIEYDRPMHGTIDDRRAAGNKHATDERYFAIFLSWYSRRADALVRSMERIAQRLKDAMQAG